VQVDFFAKKKEKRKFPPERSLPAIFWPHHRILLLILFIQRGQNIASEERSQ
jgi:hypothetical protein